MMINSYPYGNKKRTLISQPNDIILHIMKHIALISIFITITSALPSSTAYAKKQSITQFPEIERYVGQERLPEAISDLIYMPDGTAYLRLSDDGKSVIKYDTRSGKEIEKVIDLTHTRETTLPDIEGFALSPDGSKLLVYRSKKMIYRRSFDALYYVYELRSRILKPLSTEHPRQQSPVFSPDGRMVAFVSDNNIFLKKLDYGTEVSVTKDGFKNRIINGIPDWTYEEEFSTTCSMVWSPDNLTLCYIKYDESDVPTFSFEMYEGSCQPDSRYTLYPGLFTYKYPVAGQPNSKVSVHSYDVETRKTKQIDLPDTQIEYIPRIAYGHDAARLMVTTLNRAQTRMELYSVNPKSTVVKSVLVEQWNAWLSPATYENITYQPDGFIVFSCRSGYQHLYKYAYTGASLGQLTSGDFDVDAYYGTDHKGNSYYRSTATGAINRVICKTDRKGKVTYISPEHGTASASFSPAMNFHTITYSSVTKAPEQILYATESNKKIRTLVDNSTYQTQWNSAPKPEFFTMDSEGYTLNGYIIKPAGFDASKHYPVIMYQYSGPGSQEVLNRWNIGAENYFAKAGYVVICVDGRGTGGRGRAFSDVVYKRLGYYETKDQIAAANYAASLPYTDPKRIAIYGWSYGGYEAIMAASHHSAPYAAAIAVAPVTDWRYYDTVYAERYMLTPAENEDGYNSASTISQQNLQNRKCPLLIMTGTADDNVHMFNTIQYVSETEAAGLWCDMLLFPNMNHSINGCNSRSVVFGRLLDYLNRVMP